MPSFGTLNRRCMWVMLIKASVNNVAHTARRQGTQTLTYTIIMTGKNWIYFSISNFILLLSVFLTNSSKNNKNDNEHTMGVSETSLAFSVDFLQYYFKYLVWWLQFFLLNKLYANSWIFWHTLPLYFYTKWYLTLVFIIS